MRSQRKTLSANPAMLIKIATHLEAHARGRNLSSRQASIDASVLRMLAHRYSTEWWSKAKVREFEAALMYAIGLELQGKSAWKKVRDEVAARLVIEGQTVSNDYTKHKPAVQEWISRLTLNPDYEGLERAEMLKREQESIADRYQPVG
jgi:hypothetical protein